MYKVRIVETGWTDWKERQGALLLFILFSQDEIPRNGLLTYVSDTVKKIMEISGCSPRIRRNGHLDGHSYGNNAISTLKERIDPWSVAHPKKKIEGSTSRTRA